MAIGTLDTYLIDGEQKFDEAAKAERWYLTFAIPRVDRPEANFGAILADLLT